MTEQQILGRKDERSLVKEALGMLCTVSNPPSSPIHGKDWNESLHSLSICPFIYNKGSGHTDV